MTTSWLDDLARLFAAAPSRRAFLLQVGGILLVGAMDRVGLPLPSWAPPRKQCGPTRDGMRCGECGICQQGKCIPGPDDGCRRRGGMGGECRLCDPDKLRCQPCPAGQACCGDGCCEGPCVDGVCCPKDKICGNQCCHGCDVCRDGHCEKPAAPKDCPPNYVPLDGCCVCLPALCGGVCCKDPAVCLGGRCCNRCGMDGAVCCDDRVCCRERCQDPGKPCCPCTEDISAEESEEIVERARETMQWTKDNGIKYGMKRGDPTRMDCTLFTARSLGELHPDGDNLSSRTLDGNCNFRRLQSDEEVRPGDVIAQPRPDTNPGSQHVGIATGGARRSTVTGIAMGNSGASDTTRWGPDTTMFVGGDNLRVYRPQKRSEKCK